MKIGLIDVDSHNFPNLSCKWFEDYKKGGNTWLKTANTIG